MSADTAPSKIAWRASREKPEAPRVAHDVELHDICADRPAELPAERFGHSEGDRVDPLLLSRMHGEQHGEDFGAGPPPHAVDGHRGDRRFEEREGRVGVAGLREPVVGVRLDHGHEGVERDVRQG